MTVVALSYVTKQRQICKQNTYEARRWGEKRINILRGRDESSKKIMQWIKGAMDMIESRHVSEFG